MEATRPAIRPAIVLALAITLFTGAVVGPASAAKRKKAHPRVSFETSGAFLTGDPVDAGVDFLPADRTGVTANDFALNCAIPASQGFDGYVVELPEKVSMTAANVHLETDDLVSPEGLYMNSYDTNCEMIGYLDKTGRLDPDTKYILVTGWVGAGISFHLSVMEGR